MKKLTAGIFATILGLTAIDAYAAVPSQNYVDTAIAGAKTFATSEAGQALTDAQAWVGQQGYLEAADISGKADTTYVDSQDAATLGTAKTYADGVAAQAELDANAYTDTKVGNLGTSADVVSYVDAKTSGIASDTELQALKTTVSGHTTSITNLTNNKLDTSTYNTDKATFETLTGAAEKYEPILDAAERAAITSGITEAKVADIATALADSAKAKSDAATAVGDAAQAKTDAATAVGDATQAKKDAASAIEAAAAAGNIAQAATTQADSAVETANTAKEAADTATTNVTNLTKTVNGNTASIGALESGKLNVVPATSVTTDGQYVLTMKKNGETMEYGWELITRSEGK